MGVALVTPFKADHTIDFVALEQLLRFHLNNGTDFLCILGTTAETPCLSQEEQCQVMHLAQQVVGGKIPLLLGFGGNNTSAIVQRLRTTDLSGWNGLLVVTPYYNKPSQEGLFLHYREIAQATTLPVVLYNVPSRTGVNLETATTLRIANECHNVVAVKEASGNLEQIKGIIDNAPAGFQVLSGDDSLTLDILTLGGVGVISVLGNVYPAQFRKMVHAQLEDNHPLAQRLHQRFEEMYRLLSVEGNPTGVKCFLNHCGLIANELRLPLVPASEGTCQLISKFVSEAHDDLMQ